MSNDAIRVAVTGVGGGVGQSILKCLQYPRFTVVGFDEHHLAAGLFAVPIAYRTPAPGDPQYIDVLLRYCKKESCHFLFPGLDSELLKLSESRERFAKIGTTVIVSDLEVIQSTDDKYRTYEVLANAGVAVPKTLLLKEVLDGKNLVFPAVLKPKKGGSRSVDVYVVHNHEELKCALGLANKKSEYILQEWIDGPEYTCGTVNLDNHCQGVIIMRRTLRSGDTYKCFVERNPVIEDTVIRVANTLKPFGGLNVQLRLRDGVPTVFEINARCSGTTAARALAGFNEPRIIIDYLAYGKKPQFRIREISVLRYWQELIASEEAVHVLQSTGAYRSERRPKL